MSDTSKSLTVAQLRTLIADLPDDVIVKFKGNNTSNELSHEEPDFFAYCSADVKARVNTDLQTVYISLADHESPYYEE